MANSPPSCFGKHWVANNVKCNGGLDPTFTHPRTGSNKRDRCPWYTACGARMSANNLQPQQQLVPVQNLNRNKAQPPPVPNPFQQTLGGFLQGGTNVARQFGNIQVRHPKPAQVQVQPQVPQAPQQQPQQIMFAGHPSPPYVHPAMASMPAHVPSNFSAPGMQMPAYLTVPEPIVPGQSLARPFAATVMRSMLKAFGHATANWFDHVPMNAWGPYT